MRFAGNMNTTLPILTVTLALGLAACDSKQENMREKAVEQRADNLETQADITKNQAERKADEIEKQGKENATLDKKGADQTATAVRKDGDATAEVLKDTADAVRDTK